MPEELETDHLPELKKIVAERNTAYRLDVLIATSPRASMEGVAARRTTLPDDVRRATPALDCPPPRCAFQLYHILRCPAKLQRANLSHAVA
jgi:hypothetical protein